MRPLVTYKIGENAAVNLRPHGSAMLSDIPHQRTLPGTLKKISDHRQTFSAAGTVSLILENGGALCRNDVREMPRDNQQVYSHCEHRIAQFHRATLSSLEFKSRGVPKGCSSAPKPSQREALIENG